MDLMGLGRRMGHGGWPRRFYLGRSVLDQRRPRFLRSTSAGWLGASPFTMGPDPQRKGVLSILSFALHPHTRQRARRLPETMLLIGRLSFGLAVWYVAALLAAGVVWGTGPSVAANWALIALCYGLASPNRPERKRETRPERLWRQFAEFAPSELSGLRPCTCHFAEPKESNGVYFQEWGYRRVGRPTDLEVAAALCQVLDLATVPEIAERYILHLAPGRAVERLVIGRGSIALKWRDDRVNDREALLYRGLAPCVLRVLGAPRMLGAAAVGPTHLLFLDWVRGVAADWGKSVDVVRAFGHLGHVHAVTARLLNGPRCLFSTGEAWEELLPGVTATDGADGEPLVLDTGDLRAENFILLDEGGVCLLDFENMAVRPRVAGLRQLCEHSALAKGALADLALAAYWAGARWPDEMRAFRAQLCGARRGRWTEGARFNVLLSRSVASLRQTATRTDRPSIVDPENWTGRAGVDKQSRAAWGSTIQPSSKPRLSSRFCAKRRHWRRSRRSGTCTRRCCTGGGTR